MTKPPTSSSKVRHLFHWLMHGNTATALPLPMQRHSLRQVAEPRNATPIEVQHTPRLRVLRVFEGGQPQKAAGRMRISGRMADVCAELDRLAA
jgi:hypothetical protein